MLSHLCTIYLDVFTETNVVTSAGDSSKDGQLAVECRSTHHICHTAQRV